MDKTPCSNCGKLKVNTACQVCESLNCKQCRVFLEESTFSFLGEIPPDLAHTFYCRPCYDEKVVPALHDYDEVLERAKKTYVFFKAAKRTPRLIKRHHQSVNVELCLDRDETVLRLAFFAAQNSYNALIDTELTSTQVRNSGYQKLVWRGSAVPAQVDGEKLEREDIPHRLRKIL